MVPPPADGVEVMVGGVSVVEYVGLKEPGSIVSQRGASVTEKEMSVAVADVYDPSESMVAPMVQVPDVTKATRPDRLLMVQAPVVELVKCLVPEPALGVEVIVGGVSVVE